MPSVPSSFRYPDTSPLLAASITSSCFCLALRGSFGPSPPPLLGFGSSFPSLPSLPLPRRSTVAAAGHRGVAATRLSSQTLDAVQGGRRGLGSRGKKRESADRRYSGGSRGLRKKERLEQTVPPRLKRPGDIGLAGHLPRPGARTPEDKGRWCEGAGRLPRERCSTPRRSTTSWGTVA